MPAFRPIRLIALAALLAVSTCASTEVQGDDPTGDAASGVAASGVATRGDVANGKAVVMSSCSACHGLTKDSKSAEMVGPTLFGVVGRKAGTVKSILGPSQKLKQHGVIWDAETLDEFLANPLAFLAPDSAMAGILKDPQQRADVIAFLATLKE
jgi:cytochrome c